MEPRKAAELGGMISSSDCSAEVLSLMAIRGIEWVATRIEIA
jgi:hypothetical protein